MIVYKDRSVFLDMQIENGANAKARFGMSLEKNRAILLLNG